MSDQERPLSPHLSIYQWQVSNTLSILHRMTGVFLSIGAIVLVAWIVSAAGDRETFDALAALLSGPLGLLLMLGWSFCLFFHLANGIRHLVWDAGYGFDQERARLSGWFVLSLAVFLTAAFWAVVVTSRGLLP